ncbi:MAG: DUF6089 family protein [Flavobacteriales bacterium]|nr:DUF6089 family protein [Flavobacteriales bacterium]
MKKLLLLFFVITACSATAQYDWDYGIKIGAANYLGDIGGKMLTRRDFIVDMHLKATKTAWGIYGRHKFSKRLSVAGNLDYIALKDFDRWTTNPPRRARNMNFRNRMFELGVRAELTIWYDNDVGGRGYYNPDFKMYLFGGLAGYYTNPQAQVFTNGEMVSDTWYNLRDWRTEGQEKSYSKIGLAIPAGVGMYFTFDKTWRFGFEFSWRTTFNDYIDDVSTVYTNPNPKNPEDYPLALQFVNQSTYQGLIDQINIDSPESEFYPLHIQDFTIDDDGLDVVKRGDPTHNDSYLTMQLTAGKVIRGRSKFYRAKYSWLKNRATVRRSRAKF